MADASSKILQIYALRNAKEKQSEMSNVFCDFAIAYCSLVKGIFACTNVTPTVFRSEGYTGYKFIGNG